MSAGRFNPATVQFSSRTAVELAERALWAEAGTSAPSITTSANASVITAYLFQFRYLKVASRAIFLLLSAKVGLRSAACQRPHRDIRGESTSLCQRLAGVGVIRRHSRPLLPGSGRSLRYFLLRNVMQVIGGRLPHELNRRLDINRAEFACHSNRSESTGVNTFRKPCAIGSVWLTMTSAMSAGSWSALSIASAIAMAFPDTQRNSRFTWDCCA